MELTQKKMLESTIHALHDSERPWWLLRSALWTFLQTGIITETILS